MEQASPGAGALKKTRGRPRKYEGDARARNNAAAREHWKRRTAWFDTQWLGQPAWLRPEPIIVEIAGALIGLELYWASQEGATPWQRQEAMRQVKKALASMTRAIAAVMARRRRDIASSLAGDRYGYRIGDLKTVLPWMAKTLAAAVYEVEAFMQGPGDGLRGGASLGTAANNAMRRAVLATQRIRAWKEWPKGVDEPEWSRHVELLRQSYVAIKASTAEPLYVVKREPAAYQGDWTEDELA